MDRKIITEGVIDQAKLIKKGQGSFLASLLVLVEEHYADIEQNKR